MDLGIKNYVFRVAEYTYYADQITIEKQTISPEEMERRNKGLCGFARPIINTIKTRG